MLPANIRSAGVITVLTDPEFSPISYYAAGSTTNIIGSDPDILRAMGKELGVTIQFIPVAFSGMLTGVESGRGSLAGGGLTDTAVREAQVSFVDDFKLGELYVVKAGSTLGVSSDLLSVCGLRVAFTIGALSATEIQTTNSKCLAAGKPAIKEIGFSDINATILGVLSGRVDVTSYDDLGFAKVNQANQNQLQSFKISPYPGQYWGFAVSPSNTQLQNALLAALKAIVANGQYASILATYGLQSNALNSPGINLQTVSPQGA